MQQASYLEGGPLLWILPLYLHVNKKSDDDSKIAPICGDLNKDVGITVGRTMVIFFRQDKVDLKTENKTNWFIRTFFYKSRINYRKRGMYKIQKCKL